MSGDTSNTTEFITMSQSWLTGIPLDQDLLKPVAIARSNLNGWSEKDVRTAWNDLYHIFDLWKYENGMPPKIKSRSNILGNTETKVEIIPLEDAEPWDCGGKNIRDPYDLFIYLDSFYQDIISQTLDYYGKETLFSIIILREASISKGFLYHDFSIINDSVENSILTVNKAESHLYIIYLNKLVKELINTIQIMETKYCRKKEKYTTLLNYINNHINIFLKNNSNFYQDINNKNFIIQRLWITAVRYFILENPKGNEEDFLQWITKYPYLTHATARYNDKKFEHKTIRRLTSSAKNTALEQIASNYFYNLT